MFSAMPIAPTKLSRSTEERSYRAKHPTLQGAGAGTGSVLAKLRAFIEENAYQVGQVLPPERVLAETFGVGRPAIREAMKALNILDVIESRRGAGTYVKSLEGLRADWPATTELHSVTFNLLDLLEVRKMIEPTAARLAAARASHEELVRIERECVAIENASDWEEMAAHDLALHTAIIDAAANPVLTGINAALARLSRKSREETGHNAPDQTQMIIFHRSIVDAILRGEGEAAERFMLEHLHRVGIDLVSNRKR